VFKIQQYNYSVQVAVDKRVLLKLGYENTWGFNANTLAASEFILDGRMLDD